MKPIRRDFYRVKYRMDFLSILIAFLVALSFSFYSSANNDDAINVSVEPIIITESTSCDRTDNCDGINSDFVIDSGSADIDITGFSWPSFDLITNINLGRGDIGFDPIIYGGLNILPYSIDFSVSMDAFFYVIYTNFTASTISFSIIMDSATADSAASYDVLFELSSSLSMEPVDAHSATLTSYDFAIDSAIMLSVEEINIADVLVKTFPEFDIMLSLDWSFSDNQAVDYSLPISFGPISIENLSVKLMIPALVSDYASNSLGYLGDYSFDQLRLILAD